MSVKGLMVSPSDEIAPGTSVTEACRWMSRSEVGAVAVVEEGKLCGIFTYKDLLNRVVLEKRDPETTELKEVMTADVDTLGPDDSYGEALRIMVESGYTYLPVAGDNNKLVGMLSLRGLLQHRIDALANELDSVSQYLSVDGPGGD